MVASRFSPSSEPPVWLHDVYERRRRRTVRLVELSIAALQRDRKRISLAVLARVSRSVDPGEPEGVSESAILHNEEAYALYRQHADHRRRYPRQGPSNGRTHVGGGDRLRVSADRDPGRARRRYLRASKADLVERLVAAELAYSDMRARWLKTADELLVWIMLVDRLVATKMADPHW